jgi:hypothetical protein
LAGRGDVAAEAGFAGPIGGYKAAPAGGWDVGF